jgi:hypothetical protein
MHILEKLKNQALEAYQKAQAAKDPAERSRWLQEYQRRYRIVKTQEAILAG